MTDEEAAFHDCERRVYAAEKAVVAAKDAYYRALARPHAATLRRAEEMRVNANREYREWRARSRNAKQRMLDRLAADRRAAAEREGAGDGA